MKIFVVANPKGGSGKSTLATNLAGYWAQTGQLVMLGDIDRQQSSRDWLRIRPASAPAIRGWEIGDNGIARPPKKADCVVLDTPAGLHGKMLEKVLELDARIIVPVQPSLFDMLATRRFLDDLLKAKRIRKGQVDVAVVGMRVDPRTRAAGELESMFAEIDLPVLACLRSTQVYVQAIGAGLTIFDLPRSRAEREWAQWEPIIDWIQSA